MQSIDNLFKYLNPFKFYACNIIISGPSIIQESLDRLQQAFRCCGSGIFLLELLFDNELKFLCRWVLSSRIILFLLSGFHNFVIQQKLNFLPIGIFFAQRFLPISPPRFFCRLYLDDFSFCIMLSSRILHHRSFFNIFPTNNNC